MSRRFLSLALATPSLAYAGQCEDSFVKQGSIISGMRFTATVRVADLPPDVAINQFRGIVASRGYYIIAAEPTAGQLLIEQSVTQNARAFPIEINATSGGGTGTVVIEAKLRAGQSTKADGDPAARHGAIALGRQLPDGARHLLRILEHQGSGLVAELPTGSEVARPLESLT